MSWLHVPQLLLAFGAALLIVRRVRVVLYRAPLQTRLFLDAISPALQGGHRQLARAIAQGCADAWAARLVLRATDPDEPAMPEEIDQLRFELEQASVDGLRAIHTLGRMASPLGFIVVIIELGRSLEAGDGLLALSRGAALSRGLGSALTAFAIGLATSVVCFSTVALLQRRARALRADLAKTAQALTQQPPTA